MNSINRISGLFILLLISVSVFSSNGDPVKVERDVQESLTARVIEGKIYFNLSMLNESKPGMYSLVKTYADGTFESVGVKEIAVNTINQPLLYCFTDENKSNEVVIYELIRISLEVEKVETWQYCPMQDEICSIEMMSVNE